MFKIGQREVTFLVFLAVMIGSVLLGETPDGLYERLLGVIAPLGIMVATLVAMVQTINTRVAAGDIKPGSFKDLLMMREFWYGIAVWLVAGVGMIGTRFFGIEFGDETKEILITMVVNIGLAAVPLMMKNWDSRPSTAAPRSIVEAPAL